MGKQEELLVALERAPGPLSGEELAAHLGVSARSVRNYVKSLNRRSPVVTATHKGYLLNKEIQQGTRRPSPTPAGETPATRLRFITRHLAKHTAPTSIYDLAKQLFISESTLETDLTRARDVLRQNDLTLRRDRDLIWAEGPERSRRRLLRSMLKSPTDAVASATWQAFCAEYSQFAVPELKSQIAAAVDASELDFNEYALADLVMHLVVSVERVRSGSLLPDFGVPADADRRVLAMCEHLDALVAARYGVQLPPSERAALYGVLAVRAGQGADPAVAERVIDARIENLVRELLEEVSELYLLGSPDAESARNLSLHVQNLIARTNSGTSLVSPLGESFKADHPLVHDVALAFARKLETRLDLRIDPGELDYLSFHLGMQYMRYMADRDLVTVTLVVPRYYDLAERAAERVGEVLRGSAVIEEVNTSLEFDFTSVSTDLVVSCIQPSGPSAAPVVVISPFLTPRDSASLLAAVGRQRDRNARRRVRTALATLIDRRAYLRVERLGSREEAIALMAEALHRSGYVEPSFCADVLEREHLSSTNFGGEFAIPHSLYMDAHETGISVLVCDDAIPWEPSVVRLVFLIALSPEGRGVFRDVLEELTRLLASRACVSALVRANGGFDEFMSVLTDLIDGDLAAGRPPAG